MFLTGTLAVPVACAFPDSLSVETETQIQLPSLAGSAASTNFDGEMFFATVFEMLVTVSVIDFILDRLPLEKTLVNVTLGYKQR